MAYAFVQAVEGSRVTSGTTITATLTTTAGHLLVAVVSRQTSSATVPTIGEVKGGGYWKQAVEYDQAVSLVAGSQGVDIWYCESATGGSTTVTATLLGFPVHVINGMNMQVMEYSGNSGHELVDQIGQANISTTSVTVTTNFNLAATNDLAVSVVAGNQSAATVPSTWNSRLADTTQKFWIADNLAAGTSGSTLSAAWTALTGATVGSALLVTFKQAGATTGPTLLQSSYTDAAFPGTASLTWNSQPYPVNPTVGNTLICFTTGIVNGSVLGSSSNLLSCRVQSMTDTAGNTWLNTGESGQDNTSGVNWTMWLCRQALGGATTLTATFNQVATSAAFLLLELSGLSPTLVVDQTASVASGNASQSWTISTGSAVRAGSAAFTIISSLTAQVNNVSSGWVQVLSDTTGVGFGAMQLSPAAGTLTATWSAAATIATDLLLTALRPAGGAGAH